MYLNSRFRSRCRQKQHKKRRRTSLTRATRIHEDRIEALALRSCVSGFTTKDRKKMSLGQRGSDVRGGPCVSVKRRVVHRTAQRRHPQNRITEALYLAVNTRL